MARLIIDQKYIGSFESLAEAESIGSLILLNKKDVMIEVDGQRKIGVVGHTGEVVKFF